MITPEGGPGEEDPADDESNKNSIQ